MTDFLTYEVEASYHFGESADRRWLAFYVPAESESIAREVARRMMAAAGLIGGRVDDCRQLPEPAQPLDVFGVTVVGLGRLRLADLVDPS